MRVVAEPVDGCGREGLQHRSSKPAGFKFDETPMDRINESVEALGGVGAPTSRSPMSSTTMTSARRRLTESSARWARDTLRGLPHGTKRPASRTRLFAGRGLRGRTSSRYRWARRQYVRLPAGPLECAPRPPDVCSSDASPRLGLRRERRALLQFIPGNDGSASLSTLVKC